MLRIILFLLTNLAVMAVVWVVMSLLGIRGQTAGGYLAICFMYGMVGSIISLLMSKWSAKRAMNVHVIENPSNNTEAWLMRTVQELATKAGIGMPEVGIFPSHQANAFATGWNKNKALVAVSSGILEQMNPEELKAVLGHEIGHIANGDMVTLALIQGVVNAFVMFLSNVLARAIDGAINSNRESSSPSFVYYIVSFVLQMAFGVLASIIVCWFSRRREFRADEAGATLANKQAMISALLTLQRGQSAEELPQDMRAMAINTSDAGKWADLFSTHPAIPKRVEALQNFNG